MPASIKMERGSSRRHFGDFQNPHTSIHKIWVGMFVSATSSLSVVRVIRQFTVHRNRVVYRWLD